MTLAGAGVQDGKYGANGLMNHSSLLGPSIYRENVVNYEWKGSVISERDRESTHARLRHNPSPKSTDCNE